MRKALIIGINEYENVEELTGCVLDATKLSAVLERNGDGSSNFSVSLHTCPSQTITRSYLRAQIESLFSGRPDIALLYFSGHGSSTSSGECLVTTDAIRHDEGIGLNEILTLANESNARDKVIILDCCYSGGMGDYAGSNFTNISDGTTILTACQESEVAIEYLGGGLFTSLLIDALYGGAADLRGEISPGSVYSYIDRSLGPWDQRPVFKTNVSKFTSLRTVTPPIDQELLRSIPQYFTNPTDMFQLGPEFEFTEPNHDPGKVEQFKVLQKYERVGLVVPVDEEHMYFAAMNKKGCKLTAMGMHYWRLASEKII